MITAYRASPEGRHRRYIVARSAGELLERLRADARPRARDRFPPAEPVALSRAVTQIPVLASKWAVGMPSAWRVHSREGRQALGPLQGGALGTPA